MYTQVNSAEKMTAQGVALDAFFAEQEHLERWQETDLTLAAFRSDT